MSHVFRSVALRSVVGLTATILLVLLTGHELRADAQEAAASSQPPRTFYVDSETGQDTADGRSPEHAWQTLDRVNEAELKPGDTVRFRSGGVWRGSLVPVSGDPRAPVTYTSFGQGPKPLILGSVPRDRSDDWVRVRENLWATLPMEYQLDEPVLELSGSQWNHHQEAGARVELTHREDESGPFVRIAAAASGTASNHVQLWGPRVSVAKGACLVLTFRARSNKPFRFPGVGILQGCFSLDAVCQVESDGSSSG